MKSYEPYIGIVCYGRGKDPERYTLPIPYVDSIRRANGRVLIIPPGEKAPDRLLEIVDGIVLAGGGDISPSYYGKDPHPTLYGVDPSRDETEMLLARVALEQGVPILAICRGLQILNVIKGGTLIQDLPSEQKTQVAHREAMGVYSSHTVTVTPDTLLATVCQSTSFSVASLHHQAILTLGEGLEATAWAEDGLIEALSLTQYPDVLAVQWHPEETASKDPIQQRLFDWLIEKSQEKPAKTIEKK